MGVSDMKGLHKWKMIPEGVQERLLSNVFCSVCGETTITNYSIKDDKLGIVLEGNCKKCGRNVARFIESD